MNTITATHVTTVENRPGTRYPYVAVCTCGDLIGMRLTRDAAQILAYGHVDEQGRCTASKPAFMGRDVCYLRDGHAGQHDAGAGNTWT